MSISFGSGGGITDFLVRGTWSTAWDWSSVTNVQTPTFGCSGRFGMPTYTCPSVSQTITIPNPTVSGFKITAVTPTSVTVAWDTANAYAPATLDNYYLGAQNHLPYTKMGLNTRSYTITGYQPNKSYGSSDGAPLLYVRDSLGQISNVLSLPFSTPKPPPPTNGGIEISKITPFSVKCALFGNWAFNDLTTWGYYRYRLNDSDWVNAGYGISELTNLIPNTAYTLEVQLVDNYDSASPSCIVTFTTHADQASMSMKVGDTWEKGKAFYNVEGIWKKAMKVYVKDQGEWKKNAS